MAVSPRRPARERNSKSVSPRRPGVLMDDGGVGGTEPEMAGQLSGYAAPRGRGQTRKLNKKSIERLRNVGFPRANEWDFGPPRKGGAHSNKGPGGSKNAAWAAPKGNGQGEDGEPFPTSVEEGDKKANINGDRNKEGGALAEALNCRGTKGTKKAYDLALKSFQDLARELGLPSSQRSFEAVPGPPGLANCNDARERERAGSAVSMHELGRGLRAMSAPLERERSASNEPADVLKEEGGPASPTELENSAVMPPFCSVDACSVRKDATRGARLLFSHTTTPRDNGQAVSPKQGTSKEDSHNEQTGGGGSGGGSGGGRAGVDLDGSSGGVGGGGLRTMGSFNEVLSEASMVYTGAGGSNEGAEGEEWREVSGSHFDSRNIFGIYHERDLRERPTTARTEYIRACVELRLSPLPVFDHLQVVGSPPSGAYPDAHAGESASTKGSTCGEGEEGEDARRPAFSLDLRSYGLGSKRSIALSAFLRTFQGAELRSLNIEGCGVPDSALAAVIEAVKKEHELASLDISGNPVKSEKTANSIAALLEQPTSLTNLQLRGCNLSLAATMVLLPRMQDRLARIKTLCIARNGLGGGGAGEALAGLIDGNTSLTDLDLSDNHLGGEQAAMTIRALAVNSSLRNLNLGWNSLCGEKVADALVEALNENHALLWLQLGHSGLGEETCLLLSEVLKRGSSIRYLGLAGNPIGPCGAQAMLQGMGEEAGGRVEGGDNGDVSDGVTRRTIDIDGCCLERKVGNDGSMDKMANAMAFDPRMPNGNYRLDLSNVFDRHVARQLQRLAHRQSGKCWIQPKLNKRAFSFPTEDPGSLELPDAGVLEFAFAANRPVVPPAWSDGHVNAALCKIGIVEDGVDERFGLQLAEVIMSTHPLTTAQGLAMLSAFSSCAKANVAAAFIRHSPSTEDAGEIMNGLKPGEREKVETPGSMGLFLRWFSSNNPTNRYRLRLGIPTERLAASRLADLNMLERRVLQLAGMKDFSQHGDWDNFRNGTLDGNPFRFPADGGWVAPLQGVLCVDYVSPFQPAYLNGGESPMSDQDFRDFVASHVVLEEEPGPMKGEVAAKAVTEAFGKFDKGGQNPVIAQACMTKQLGFPNPPTLLQVREALAKVGRPHPISPEAGITSDDDINNGAESAPGRAGGVKEKYARGEGGEDPEVEASNRRRLDADKFTRAWKILLKGGFAERRLPVLRRLSSKVWITADQLAGIVYSLKREKKQTTVSDPVEAVVFFFRRLTDRENFHRVTAQLLDSEMERVGEALGWLNIFNPFRPDGYYVLDLSRPDQKRVAAAIIELLQVPMDLRGDTLERAFSSSAFGSHTENFAPPKSWKKTLPSSGRWLFKLSVGSLRNGASSVNNSVNSVDDGATQEQDPDPTEEAATRENNAEGSNAALGALEEGEEAPTGMGAGGRGHRQDGHKKSSSELGTRPPTPTSGGVPGVDQQLPTTAEAVTADGVDQDLTPSPQKPAVVARRQRPQKYVSVWPGRAVCREVAEKNLSWEFEDGDFRVQKTDVREGGGEEGEEEAEEEAAVRAALVRREEKLRDALWGLRTNEGGVGVSGGIGP